MHLWEVKHDYYCEECNFYATYTDSVHKYKRWQDFLEEWGDADLDYNLLFRWDWQKHDNDEEPLKPEVASDPYYRSDRLNLHFMGQRKGLYHSAIIDVCRADEDAVRAYLQPRFEHMMRLWAPLTAPGPAA